MLWPRHWRAVLTAPVFQGGALRADIARTEANLRLQMESYAGIALTAYREVETGLTQKVYSLNA